MDNVARDWLTVMIRSEQYDWSSKWVNSPPPNSGGRKTFYQQVFLLTACWLKRLRNANENRTGIVNNRFTEFMRSTALSLLLSHYL